VTTAIVGRRRIPPGFRGRHVRPAGPAARSVSQLATGVLLAALVAGLVMLAAPRVVGGQALIVTSGSMGSAVPVGSVVLVRPAPAAAVRVGDVLLMREGTDGTPVLHRVVERTVVNGRISVRTKGDANPAPDPNPYRLGATAYLAATDVPGLGYAIAALRSPPGLLGLAGLLVLAAGQALRARRTRRATR
jgi:signal peptidase